MKPQQIINLCASADIEYRSYSGRGMFGSKCLAIETDNPADTVLEIVYAAIMSDDFSKTDMIELLEALGGARSDSVGLGTVVYWTHIEMEMETE